MSSREAIHAALFALGQAITWPTPGGGPPTTTGFATAFRRVKLWDSQGAVLPMLCQGERDEANSRNRQGMPRVRTWGVDWLIYFNTIDVDDFVPATTTNAILDQLDMLFPDEEDDAGPNGLGAVSGQTLGGLVHRVQINGKIRKWQGDLGGVALLLVPLEIIVP